MTVSALCDVESMPPVYGLMGLPILQEEHPNLPKRSECRDGPRPCPLVSCRYHLGLEVTHAGSIQFNITALDGEDIPSLHPRDSKEKVAMSMDAFVEALERAENTCALDVALTGESTLEEVGKLHKFTRERARQLEVKGIRKSRRSKVLKSHRRNE